MVRLLFLLEPLSRSLARSHSCPPSCIFTLFYFSPLPRPLSPLPFQKERKRTRQPHSFFLCHLDHPFCFLSFPSVSYSVRLTAFTISQCLQLKAAHPLPLSMVSTNYPVASSSATHTTAQGATSTSTSSVSVAGNANLSSPGPSPDSPLLNVPGNKTRASSRSPSASASLSQHHYIMPSEDSTTALKTGPGHSSSRPSMAKLCILSPTYSEPFYLPISLQSTTSVAQLKTLLSQKHPCQPSPSDSRLVYRGHILNDVLLISECFKDVVEGDEKDALITMHLVLGPTSSLTTAASRSLPPGPTRIAPPLGSPAPSKREPPPPASNAHLGHFSDSISLPLTSVSASCLYDCDALANCVLAFDPEPGQLFMIENLLYKYTLWNGFPYLIPVYNEPGVESMMGMDCCWTASQPPLPTAAAQEEPPVAAAGAPPENPLPRHPGSLGLAIKLIFFLFVFTQNASVLKATILCLLTVVIFLHQTGRLVIVRRQAAGGPRPTPQAESATDTTRPNDEDVALPEVERSAVERIRTIVVSFLLSIIPAPDVPVDE